MRLLKGSYAGDQIAFYAFPFILRGSPNECWLYICRICVTATWRLGPVEPLMEKQT